MRNYRRASGGIFGTGEGRNRRGIRLKQRRRLARVFESEPCHPYRSSFRGRVGDSDRVQYDWQTRVNHALVKRMQQMPRRAELVLLPRAESFLPWLAIYAEWRLITRA